ncbi:MAG: hypothetical protein C5B59_09400 [Bacteroidetes bacterium]|nr:MAG: hypothetical protein C5B59_09400 [Bacteroidota bacterium]
MKKIAFLVAFVSVLSACENKKNTMPIEGTWQLITGTLIDKKDTTVTQYTKDKKFIKIINNNHFAFLSHDLNKGKDSASASFGAGGGKYTLSDSTYTEHLEYCNDRVWENNDFSFTITIQNDTLTQKGIEKVAGTGIERLNIERYVRLAN